MRTLLPFLALGVVAYVLFRKKEDWMPSPVPAPQIPWEPVGRSSFPPRGFKTKYAYSRPVGAYYTGKIEVRPAPFGAVIKTPRLVAEVILSSGKKDFVEVVPISTATMQRK